MSPLVDDSSPALGTTISPYVEWSAKTKHLISICTLLRQDDLYDKERNRMGFI